MTCPIQIIDVSKTFFLDNKVFSALNNVSLSINKGEIFGLLGPNGAGKTTLINILIGLLTPDSGQVRILDYDIVNERTKVIPLINSVSSESDFHPLMTVKEILMFFGTLYGLKNQEKDEHVDWLVERFEIEDIQNKKYGWLSTGQKSRVLLAKSLINKPQILFLDEPTLGLDPDIAQKTRDLILKINKESKTTILLTSHYMSEVEKLCNRIAFINQGQILDHGDIETVKKRIFPLSKIIVKIRDTDNNQKIKQFGFKLNGNMWSKSFEENELDSILEKLVNQNIKILDIKTERPDLEDYFINMVEKN